MDDSRIGEEAAELPDGFVNINTSNKTFSVHQPRPDSQMKRIAHFVVAEDGGLRIKQVQGALSGYSDPEKYATILVREDAMVRTIARKASVRSSKSVVDFAAWPHLTPSTFWLHTPYPEFDDYDNLIDRAFQAFDFFLSDLDPRTNGPEQVTPIQPTVGLVASPRFLGGLTYRADRDNPLSGDERELIQSVLKAMPQAKGDGLNVRELTDSGSGLLAGESEIWPEEPAADTVNDLHRKLNALTLIRHGIAGSAWQVHLADMIIPWNDELGRFEPPS